MNKLPLLLVALLAWVWLGAGVGVALADDQAAPPRLGVLTQDGPKRAIVRRQATVDHLNRALVGHRFVLVPLDLAQVPNAVAAGSVDLVLSSPLLQVDLGSRFGAKPLATLQTLIDGQPQSQFGGVIFTTTRRFSVETLENLRGLRLAAVDRDSLGGFLSAWLELQELGIEPYSELMLHFEGSAEGVVRAVVSGEMDAGVVRAQVLEKLAAQGQLDLDEIRVLASRRTPEHHPVRVDTRLDPIWTLSALPHLDHPTTSEITKVLFGVDPDSTAAGIGGWNPPADFRPGHELPPYADQTDRPALTYLDDDTGWIVALILAYLALAYTAGRAIRDKRALTDYRVEVLDTMSKEEEARRELMHRMQQLYESERRFTILAESAPDAIVLIDETGKVQFWNPAAEQVFGYTAGEMRGREVHKVLAPPDLRGPADHAMPAFAATGTGPKVGTNRELPALHKDGTIIPIELSLAAVQANGKWSSIGIMRDITERKEYQARLEQQIDRANLFFDQGGALMVMLDQHGAISRINNTALELIGLDKEAALGLSWFDLIIAPADRPRMRDRFRRAVRGDAEAFNRDTSQIMVRDIGQQCWIAWHNVVLPAEHHPDRVLCTGLDVTGNLDLKRQLQSTRASFSNVVMRNRTGILVLDANGRVQFSNPAAQSSLGRTEEDLKHFTFGVPSLHGGSELQILQPDGRIGIAEVTATQTEWDHQPAYLVMIHDVTDRKAAEERAHYLAQHDTLTGLPNRSLLMDRLDTALARAERAGQGLAVLFLDLDRFKIINDTLGHRVGDELLQGVAKRLQEHLRDTDTVARLGGDEFVVLLEGIEQIDTARAVAVKIRASFDEPLIAGDREIFTKPSVGIAAYPDHGDNTGTLMRLADTAMYHAKRHAATGVSIYREEMTLEAASEVGLAGPLVRALENHEFALHYQPKFRLGDETPVGFEALLRWQHPEKGLIPPGGFVNVLEDTGLIRRVGDWVIEEVLVQLLEWRRRGLADLPVAVNVSALQLEDTEFVDRLEAMIDRFDIAPDRLCLELTESALMKDFDSASRMLLRLDALGVGLHLDDFGTGYSSLALLDRLPFDTIKIDRTFISDLPGDGRKAALIKAIIALTQQLGMTALAEGVETRRQAEFLIQHNCDLAQGFLFARPMTLADTLTWLAKIQSPAAVKLN